MKKFYEDSHLIVAEKPADMLSERTEKGDGFADLLAAENNGYIGVLHRLDRGVGGIMIYAKTPACAATLSRAIQERTVQKEYLAIVHGDPSAQDGTLRDLLFHDRVRNKTFTVDRMRNGVKEASLEFQTLKTIEHEEYGTLSLIRVLLHTGRTHQIRVQFSSRGYPLLGDGKYGARDRCAIGLCSFRLRFPHPKTGEILTFSHVPTDGVWSLFPDIRI